MRTDTPRQGAVTSNDDRYAAQLAAGFHWLRFRPELEHEYARSAVNRFGLRLAIAGLLGIVTGGLFVLLARKYGGGFRDWMAIYACVVTFAVAFYLLAYAARLEFLLRGELREQSLLDGLTGLMNRRAFEPLCESAWLQAQRSLTPIGLMLLDVDDFQKINSRCGRAFADNALQHIAQVLKRSAMRPMDAAARYDGDQFIAIWYEVDGAWLAKLAEEMPGRIGVLKAGPPDGMLNVTVTGGAVLSWPRPGMTVQDAIRAADETLREAKAAQRGTVGYKVLRPVTLPQEKSAA